MPDTFLDVERIIAALAARVADLVIERLTEASTQTSPAVELKDEPQMAALLGISQPTLQRRRAAGDVPFVRLGRRVLYRPADVLASLCQSEKGGAA